MWSIIRNTRSSTSYREVAHHIEGVPLEEEEEESDEELDDETEILPEREMP